MKFIANTTIKHDGKTVKEGGTLECEAERVAGLIQSGALTPKRKKKQKEAESAPLEVKPTKEAESAPLEVKPTKED